MNPHVTTWTAERVAELRRLDALGWPYSKIGSELGISKNAALSKAGRIGIAPRGRQKASPKTIPRVRRTYQRRTFRFEPQIEVEPFVCQTVADLTPEQRAQTKTFAQLTEATCRYPFGDPGAPDFCFCGQQTIAEKPYCGAHWRLTHQVPVRKPARPFHEYRT